MSFFDDLMSPFSAQHCLYFYVFGLFSLLLAIIALVIGIISLFKKNYKILGGAIFYFIVLLLAYYVSRLNYSVCLGAYK